MTTLDLRGLLQALVERDVRFVVMGGVAVGAHGFVRGTAGVDLVPEPAPENLSRLVAALSAMDVTLPTANGRPFDSALDGAAIRRRRNATLDTPMGGLDMVQTLPGVPPFADLETRSVGSDVLGVPVKVCSLADLRAMKRARNSTQDRADLERLPER